MSLPFFFRHIDSPPYSTFMLVFGASSLKISSTLIFSGELLKPLSRNTTLVARPLPFRVSAPPGNFLNRGNTDLPVKAGNKIAPVVSMHRKTVNLFLRVRQRKAAVPSPEGTHKANPYPCGLP